MGEGSEDSLLFSFVGDNMHNSKHTDGEVDTPHDKGDEKESS